MWAAILIKGPKPEIWFELIELQSNGGGENAEQKAKEEQTSQISEQQ